MTMVFTFGEAHDFHGGWTEVTAPDAAACLEAFKMYHPSTDNGALQCAGVYRMEDFLRTSMGEKGSNRGKGCMQRITLTMELLEG